MKRFLLFLAFVAFIAIVIGVAWMVYPVDAINAANVDRIEAGMTEADVTRILGDAETDNFQQMSDGHAIFQAKSWSRSNRNTIIIRFKFENGKWIVEDKQCFVPTFWDRVKEWWDDDELIPIDLRSTRLEADA